MAVCESRQIQTAVRASNVDWHGAAQFSSISAAARLPTLLSFTLKPRSSSGLSSENTFFICPECFRKAETMRSLPRGVRATIRTRRSSALSTRLTRPFAVAVPEFLDDRLSNSSLIVADQMETVPAKNVGTGSFVIGTTKVRRSPPVLRSSSKAPNRIRSRGRVHMGLTTIKSADRASSRRRRIAGRRASSSGRDPL